MERDAPGDTPGRGLYVMTAPDVPRPTATKCRTSREAGAAVALIPRPDPAYAGRREVGQVWPAAAGIRSTRRDVIGVRRGSEGGDLGRRAQRSLSPVELTETVVLGDVCVALCVVGRFLPGGGALRLAAVVPFAAVAARHRVRVAVTSAVAATAVGFLVAGASVVSSILACAVLGAVVGVAFRREWSAWRTALVAAVGIWPPIAAGVVGALIVFSDCDAHVCASAEYVARHKSNLAGLGLDRVASAGNQVVAFTLRWWWAFVPLALLSVIITATLVAQLIAAPVLRRLEHDLPSSAVSATATPTDVGRPGPVPVRFAAVGYSFPVRCCLPWQTCR